MHSAPLYPLALLALTALSALAEPAKHAAPSMSAQETEERPSKPLARLTKPPALDGKLQDFSPALTLQPLQAEGSTANFTAKVALWKDTLYLGIEATDDTATPGDELLITLAFAGAGPMAQGLTYRFAADGKRASPVEAQTPAFAQELVQAKVSHGGNALTLETAFPARALPRFPVRGPLILDLCITYRDVDAVGAAAHSVSNCHGASMVGDTVQVPDSFRKGLKLEPPALVTTLEPQPMGWFGYGASRGVIWVQSSQPLTRPALQQAIAPGVESAAQLNLNTPEFLTLPGGARLLSVLTGKNPFAAEDACNAAYELRVQLFLVKEQTAERALDWPAATCVLGRALSMILDEHGSLTMGYSSGATVNFTWSDDHFERTELGLR